MAILKSAIGPAFKFPGAMDLPEDYLERFLVHEVEQRTKLTKLATKNIVNLKALKTYDDSMNLVLDASSGLPKLNFQHGTSPCITKTRGGSRGHYLTKYSRWFNIYKIGALQGWPKSLVHYMLQHGTARCLGRFIVDLDDEGNGSQNHRSQEQHDPELPWRSANSCGSREGFVRTLMGARIPRLNAFFTTEAVGPAEVSKWLCLLVERGTGAVCAPGLTSHGLKSTSLSWLTKAGYPERTRLILGHHSQGPKRTMFAYGRDEQAAPLRSHEECMSSIRAGTFQPDQSRSGMVVVADSAILLNPSDSSFEALNSAPTRLSAPLEVVARRRPSRTRVAQALTRPEKSVGTRSCTKTSNQGTACARWLQGHLQTPLISRCGRTPKRNPCTRVLRERLFLHAAGASRV